MQMNNIILDEDVLASNQEISTADQNFQSFSKNNICSDENDDDDEENDEEESFYSLSGIVIVSVDNAAVLWLQKYI